eukprot:675825_1
MNIHKLIYGFIHNLEDTCVLCAHVPDAIKNIIFMFYPKTYQLASVGCICSPFVILQLDSSFFHPNDLHYAFDHLYIKTLNNCIYTNHTTENKYILHDQFHQMRCIRHKQNGMHSLKFIDRVKMFECGQFHGFVVTNNDKIYAIGDNKCSQFGNSSYTKQVLYDAMLLTSHTINSLFTNRNIIKICCGHYHTLFLDDTGNVYSCGWHKYGQCGIPSINNCILEPTQITGMKCMDVGCGAYHSLCVDIEHRLYGFGCNENAQLSIALNANTKRIKAPTLIPCFSTGSQTITNVLCCSMIHNIVANADGMCYLFESCSGEHTLLLTENNKVYGFGLNTNGECQDKVELASHNPWDIVSDEVHRMYFKNVCDPIVMNEYLGIKQSDVVVNILAGRGYSSVICLGNELL